MKSSAWRAVNWDAPLPVRIFELDYRTGQRTLWREFAPTLPARAYDTSIVPLIASASTPTVE